MAQRAFDQVHRRQQFPGARTHAAQHAFGAVFRQALIGLDLAPSGQGRLRETAAAVFAVGGDRDQTFGLEAAQQAAEQAAVDAEFLAQGRHRQAGITQRPQGTGNAQGAATAQERGIQRADLAGDGAVEAADTGDIGQWHDS